MSFRAFVATLAWVTAARAMGPPVMIHTKDGSIYYGELVERVETKGDEHVTILPAAGVPRRIALKDIDPTPVTLPIVPREEHATPTVTVRTLNGSAYHGELVERVSGVHIVLKLATGEVKTIDWQDIDQLPPPPPPMPPREAAPIENVRTKNGSIYHGEIIEKVVRDHVTVRLATSEIKTIDWDDLSFEPVRVVRAHHVAPPPPPKDPVLVVSANVAGAALERKDINGIFTEVCRAPCQDSSPYGTYRISASNRIPTSIFSPGMGETHVQASLGSKTWRRVGMITTLSSAPVIVTGIVMLVVSASLPSWTTTVDSNGFSIPTKHDNTDFNAATVMVNISGFALLVAGLGVMVAMRSHVTVNGATF